MTTRPWTCPTCGAEYNLEPVEGIRGEPLGRPAEPGEERLTENQGKALYALGQELPGKKVELLGLIAMDYGVDGIDALTKGQASQLIARLQRQTRR